MAYALTRDDILERALLKVGVKIASVTAAQKTLASDTLNDLVNSWQNDIGLLWKETWVSKTLTASSTVSGYRCIRPHTSGASTQPGTGADWETYWVTDSTGTGTWVTATAYTAIGHFALSAGDNDIISAFIRRSELDYPLLLIGAKEFAKYAEKYYDQDIPTTLYLEKSVPPTVHLYPQPDDTSSVLHYLKVSNITETETDVAMDFEKRYHIALIWGLALELSLDYGISPTRYGIIKSNAVESKRVLKEAQQESIDSPFLDGAY